MKHCTKCGTELDDAAVFCAKCGAPQATTNQDMNQQAFSQQPNQPVNQQINNQATYSQPSGYNQPPKKSSKGVVAVIIALAVILVVAIAAVVCVFAFKGKGGSKGGSNSGSSSIESAVKNYYKALASGDVDDFIKVTCTSKMKKAVAAAFECDESELADVLEEEWLDDFKDANIKIKDVKVTDKEKVDKSEITQYIDSVKESTDVTIEMSEVYDVSTTFSIRDDEWMEGWEDEEDSIQVYKANGKWYVLLG